MERKVTVSAVAINVRNQADSLKKNTCLDGRGRESFHEMTALLFPNGVLIVLVNSTVLFASRATTCSVLAKI